MNPIHADHGGAFFEAIGAGFDHLERRHEIVNADVLDAWYDPAPGVLSAIREHLPWLLKTSPPTHGEGLAAALALARGIDENCLLLGAGTSSLMYQTLPHLVPTGGKAVISDPTYGEYPHLVEQVLGARLVRVPARPDWRVDFDRLAAGAKGADLVVLANPNSPTGALESESDMKGLLAELGPRTRLWVDETYIDFAEGTPTLEPLVGADPRLIVAKSMSKYYALSGVRAGYLALHPELRATLERTSPPWPIGLVGQVAAVMAIGDPAYYLARTVETRRLAEALEGGIAEVGGLRPLPTQANFLLVEVLTGEAAEWAKALRELGVFVRDATSISERFQGRFIRIAVKDKETNGRILSALKSVSRQFS